MRKSQAKNRLTKRVLPVFLALVLLVSTLAVAFGVISAAAADGQFSNGEQIYFNLTKNTGWYTSGKLYALFYYNNSYVGRALCASTPRSDGIYSVAVPATANSVELVVMASDTKLQSIFDDYNSHKTHAYFDNSSKGWGDIKAFIWDASGNGKVAWPGEAMQNLSGSVWWYDVPSGYSNIIFSNNGNNQTPDLGIQSDLSYYDGSTWVSVFSKTTPRTSMSSRKGSANEIYLEGNKLRLSKYPYPGHSFSNGKTVYLYNPNWKNAYVNYDLGDPYVIPTPIKMTAVSGKPAGYFQATVPADATIEFLPGTVSGLGSKQTVPPTDDYNNCYKIANGVEAWVRLQDAEASVNTDYYAGIGTGYDNNSAFWVEATYFDYLSDTERNGSWLRPGYVGTVFDGDKAWQNHTKNGMNKEDNWYPFKDFNQFISQNTSGWTYPLYFGNFCNTSGSYDNGHTRNGPYNTMVSQVHDFSYAANNSNALTDYHYSVQELAYDRLDSDGNIQYAAGKKMPYFNADLLKQNYNYKPVAKSVKSYFPFEYSSTGTDANKVTTYTFKSTTNSNHNVAKDNVFFNWSSGIPSTVNFGKGSNYAIEDGHADFVVDETNGYGIFPFNNANSNSGNPGNGQLDFGFGIRLDMDFKVPANGKLPDQSDVKFTFTGDDDLWVYLSPLKSDGTPDYSNSKLALDLGGNHKDAEGTINFNSMRSTVKEAALLGASGTTVNASAVAQGNEVWYANTWNNNDDHVWIKGQGSADSLSFPGLKSKFIVVRMNPAYSNNPQWNNESNNNIVWNQSADLTTQDGIYTLTGFNNYNINGSWSGDGITYKTNYSKPINFLANNAQLDPTTTYHMTVFYMERGLIESNSSITFTMTPAVNDYQVQKKIDVSNVNEALAEDILNRSDKFNFSTAGTFKGSAVTRSTSGSPLGHDETVDYYNLFDTGTTVKTTEDSTVVRSAGVSTNLSFTTKWQAIDTDAGSIIGYGNGKQTNDITLQRSDSTNNPIHIKSVFTNTPTVNPLTVSKKIVNKDGSDSDRVDNFTYTIKIDPNGGSNYQAYELDYEVGGRARATDPNGTFTFSSHETVTFPGLPVGVSYELVESPAAGYIAEQARKTGVMSAASAANTVRFTNRINPIDSQISGVKYLDGAEYEGSAFWYELRGVAQMNLPEAVNIGNGETVTKTESTASVTQTIKSTNSSGVFNFANLVFDKAGIYRYKVYENRSIHDGTSNYILGNTVYYIEVKVVKNNDALEVAYTHKNYRMFESAAAADSHTLIDDDFTSTWDGQMISAGGGTGFPDRAIRLADGTSISFNNYSKPGSISVTKSIQGNANDPTQFSAVVSLMGPMDDDFYPYEGNCKRQRNQAPRRFGQRGILFRAVQRGRSRVV